MKSLSSTIVGAQLERLGPSPYMLGTPEQEATYTVRKKIRHEYLLDRKEHSTIDEDEEAELEALDKWQEILSDVSMADDEEDEEEEDELPARFVVDENGNAVPAAKYFGDEWKEKIVSIAFTIAAAQELMC